MRLDRYGQLKTGRLHLAPTVSPELAPFRPTPEAKTRSPRRALRIGRFYDPRIGRFEAAYSAMSARAAFERRGSSGGMASWTARSSEEEPGRARLRMGSLFRPRRTAFPVSGRADAAE